MSLIMVSPCDVYERDFTITRPNVSNLEIPGNAIVQEGIIESAFKVTAMRSEYNGSWISHDVSTVLNRSTGAYSFSAFLAVLGVETITIEVTWANGAPVQHVAAFQVMAA